MKETEVWKDINGTDGRYQVSDLGNVRSVYFWCQKTKKHIKREVPKNIEGSLTANGYVRISIPYNKKLKMRLVHFLVADAFLINEANNNQVFHINGNRTDNRVKNLKYGKRVRAGGKLSDIEIKKALIKDYKSGMGHKKIEKKYGVETKALYRQLKLNNIPKIRIYNNELYISRQPRLPKKKREKMISDYENGEFPREIAKKHKTKETLFQSEQGRTNLIVRFVRKYKYIYSDYEWMFEKGMSNNEIQAIVGCSYDWVVKRRKQWNSGFFNHLKARQQRRNHKLKLSIKEQVKRKERYKQLKVGLEKSGNEIIGV